MHQALRSLAVLPDDEQAYLQHQKNEADKRLIARREKDREERQQELAGVGSRDRPSVLPSRPIGIPRKTSKQNIGPSSSSSSSSSSYSSTSVTTINSTQPATSCLYPICNPTPTLPSSAALNQNGSIERRAETVSNVTHEKEKLLSAVYTGADVCRIRV